ncbi:mitochondrial carrier [Phaffia rhodozyma]|uniref:Mitochondrial glycine transporter n=1 Tax=Phaffia rhodozyma TaxID=264483 RepID=A0A0F7SME2_PHARH|nr:mitochondrial carrier [Phaffia rhodozyma]
MPTISKTSSAADHLLSGAVSGLASSVLLQPLDLLKTRIQQQGHSSRKTWEVTKNVIRDGGVLGLWRGTAPTIVRNVPGVAVYFYTLSEIRAGLSTLGYFSVSTPHVQSSSSTATTTSSPKSSSSLVKLSREGNLLAGAIARAGVGFVLNPVTVLKARYESNLYNYSSMLQAFRSIYAESGIPGLFRGFTATAIRDAPYAGLYVLFYEEAKMIADTLIASRPELGIPAPIIHSLSGVSAATLATLATAPADCIKTKMQVLPDLHPTVRKSSSLIYKEHGINGFFSGVSLRIARKGASSAIVWTVYEGLLLGFQSRQQRSTSLKADGA